MATIKVSDVFGVRFLNCFDTLSEVPYAVEEEETDDTPEEKNPFE